MGVAPILAARSIVILATGSHKAEAVAAALTGPMTAAVPASLLQSAAPRVTWILDEAAARGLPDRSSASAMNGHCSATELRYSAVPDQRCRFPIPGIAIRIRIILRSIAWTHPSEDPPRIRHPGRVREGIDP